MIYYQINDISNKKSYFFNKNKKKVIENLLPKKIKKISLGFPSGILFNPPLKKKRDSLSGFDSYPDKDLIVSVFGSTFFRFVNHPFHATIRFHS